MRRAAVVLIFLAVVSVGPVLAQSTSTSTSTTTTTPGPPADADPPAALLAGRSGEVRAELGSYCWAPPGGTAGRCVDKIAPPTGPALSVARGETVTLRFTTGLPLTELSAADDGAELTLSQANPSQFRVDLPPGTYQLLVSARFSAGSAGYGFRLRVTAPPATPTPATNVGLTG